MEDPVSFGGRQTGVEADWGRRESKGNDRRGVGEKRGWGWCSGGNFSGRGRPVGRRWGDRGGRECSGGEPDPQDDRLCRLPIQARRSGLAQEGRNKRGRRQGRVRHNQGTVQRACLQVGTLSCTRRLFDGSFRVADLLVLLHYTTVSLCAGQSAQQTGTRGGESLKCSTIQPPVVTKA